MYSPNPSTIQPPALLPADSRARKDTPVYSGCLAYFPLAVAEVAKLSKTGNDKHNPGEPLHWSRDKSNDDKDCIARHLLEVGTIDADDGHRHSTKLAWRALANLQRELEAAAAPHASDCAVNNGPALPVGPCDCRNRRLTCMSSV